MEENDRRQMLEESQQYWEELGHANDAEEPLTGFIFKKDYIYPFNQPVKSPQLMPEDWFSYVKDLVENGRK